MRAIARPMPDEPPVISAARSTCVLYQEGELRRRQNTAGEGVLATPSPPPKRRRPKPPSSSSWPHVTPDEPHRRRRLRGEVLGRPAAAAARGLCSGRGREPARR